jgi:hypothetical protein
MAKSIVTCDQQMERETLQVFLHTSYVFYASALCDIADVKLGNPFPLILTAACQIDF